MTKDNAIEALVDAAKSRTDAAAAALKSTVDIAAQVPVDLAEEATAVLSKADQVVDTTAHDAIDKVNSYIKELLDLLPKLAGVATGS